MKSYRQELDLLENLHDALEHAGDYIDESPQAIAEQVAHEWPDDYYAKRVDQWLHAGQPDLEDTSAHDYTQTVTELIEREHRTNLTQSLHDITGVILYALAIDYLTEALGDSETIEKAHKTIGELVAEHRESLRIQTGHALTPPYSYNLLGTYNKTHTVHVTTRD